MRVVGYHISLSFVLADEDLCVNVWPGFFLFQVFEVWDRYKLFHDSRAKGAGNLRTGDGEFLHCLFGWFQFLI